MASRPTDPVEIAPDPNGLGERFMAAFNDIEHRIRETGRAKDSLSSLSREFFSRRGLTMHLDAFSDFVDLRNTLAHGRHFRGALLATPAPEVVAEVEALRDLVLSPPAALALLGEQELATCRADDDIADVLPLIAERGYSHVPVVEDDGTCSGLLTPQALARWLAATWDAGVEPVPVSDVLAHAEDKEQPAFLPTDATVAEVVAALVGDAVTPRVPAVLLTDGGTRRHHLVGIATGGDLPRLVAALELH